MCAADLEVNSGDRQRIETYNLQISETFFLSKNVKNVQQVFELQFGLLQHSDWLRCPNSRCFFSLDYLHRPSVSSMNPTNLKSWPSSWLAVHEVGPCGNFSLLDTLLSCVLCSFTFSLLLRLKIRDYLASFNLNAVLELATRGQLKPAAAEGF